MTKEETYKAFAETNFIVKPTKDRSIVLKIDETTDDLQTFFPGIETWAFITAWNPLPLVLSLEENRKRNEELENELKNNGLQYTLGLGISADEKWSEESFFVENISIEKANELAKKYGQLAFVFGYNNNEAALIYTK
jgi:hypothetical protein